MATHADIHHAQTIVTEMEESAKARGTGIAKRTPEYIIRKMEEGKAVIAVTRDDQWVGFCYIESWEHEKFVANSGLIVSPPYRKTGIAKEIKKKVFDLSRKKFPDAKIFGLTTGLAVMKINSELGYEPVVYSELTKDEEFWKGCQSCVNYEILKLKNRENCMCTGMLFDPNDPSKKKEEVMTFVTSDGHVHEKPRRRFADNFRLFERWVKFKQYVFLKSRKKAEELNKSEKRKSAFSFLFFW